MDETRSEVPDVDRPAADQLGVGGPVTARLARDLAERRATDPATVARVWHHGFAADHVCGGYAYGYDDRLLILDTTGAVTIVADPGGYEARLAVVQDHWDTAQAATLPARLAALDETMRLAVACRAAGVRTVLDLPADASSGLRPGAALTEVERIAVDSCLAYLRLHSGARTALDAVRALEGQVERGHRTALAIHACGVCGYPALGEGSWDRTVCEVCAERTVCVHGRLVHVVGPARRSDPLGAAHVDDDSACEVTATTRTAHVGVVAVTLTPYEGDVVIEVADVSNPRR